MLIVLNSCIKVKTPDNTSTIGQNEKNDPVEYNLEVKDQGAGAFSTAMSYEKLLVPANYKHFCQFNSSTNVTSCGLPTLYMIGKGFFGSPVDDHSLQQIITGMGPYDFGISGLAAYFYAQYDLGTPCTDYFTYSDKGDAFIKITETIKDGFPLINLINIKKVDSLYQLTSDTIHTRHWVLVVGIRVNKQNLKRGEIIFIDPLSKTPKLKYAQSEDFLNSCLSASTAIPQVVNMIKIGCPGQAMTGNYLGSISPVSGQTPNHKSVNVQVPVTLSWNSMGTGAGYRIQVAMKNEEWSEINGFVENHLNHMIIDNYISRKDIVLTENLLEQNKDYFWTVKTFVNGVSSNFSAPIYFRTKPAIVSAPIALPATQVTDSSFECNWTGAHIFFENYYDLRVAKDTGFTQLVIGNTYSWGAPFYSVQGLNSNTWYYYKVRTVLEIGESPWSNVIAVKTN